MGRGRHALIVGAGIGGLAAGLSLRRAGWRVTILERAASPRELGFALNLAPNATAALRDLGVAHAVIAAGVTPMRLEVRRPDGRVLKRAERRPGASTADPHIVALRTALHGALLAPVEDAVRVSSRATAFTVDPNGVTLSLESGETITGDVLVGADGVASVVRAQLHPDEPPPRSSPYISLRGVAYGALAQLEDVDAAAYLGAGVEAAAARAGADAIYWYMSLLAKDVGAERQAEAVLARHTEGFDPRFVAITRATRPNDLRLDALVDRAPIRDWGRGPVTLLGDAAHPMLPHVGQGAAQALEDAVVLGRTLTGADDIVAALRRYERQRASWTRRMVRNGRRIARTTTTRNPLVLAMRGAMIRLLSPRMLEMISRASYARARRRMGTASSA